MSSGEAEYYGIVKGATMGIRIKSLLGDLGMPRDMMKLLIYTDSSTAKSIAQRRGVGRVRHIEVCQLWIQQEVQNGRIDVAKVKGTNNLADILTKHVDNTTLARHIGNMATERRTDRHQLNPQKARDQ